MSFNTTSDFSFTKFLALRCENVNHKRVTSERNEDEQCRLNVNPISFYESLSFIYDIVWLMLGYT